jgi:hypothetical protein
LAAKKSNDHIVCQRLSSGFTELATASRSSFGNNPNFDLYAMAGNIAGTASNFSNSEFGSFGVGLGFSSTEATLFTLALKNLWETSTGLALP